MIQNKISKYLSIQREVLGTSFGIAQYRILSILNLIVVYELKDFLLKTPIDRNSIFIQLRPLTEDEKRAQK